jgi:hypothetical protein
MLFLTHSSTLISYTILLHILIFSSPVFVEKKDDVHRQLCYLNGILIPSIKQKEQCLALSGKDNVVFFMEDRWSLPYSLDDIFERNRCDKVGEEEATCTQKFISAGAELRVRSPTGGVKRAKKVPPPRARRCEPERGFKWALVRGVTRCVRKKRDV